MQIVIFPSKKRWVQIVIFPSKKLWVQIVIFPSKKRWVQIVIFPSKSCGCKLLFSLLKSGGCKLLFSLLKSGGCKLLLPHLKSGGCKLLYCPCKKAVGTWACLFIVYCRGSELLFDVKGLSDMFLMKAIINYKGIIKIEQQILTLNIFIWFLYVAWELSYLLNQDCFIFQEETISQTMIFRHQNLLDRTL